MQEFSTKQRPPMSLTKLNTKFWVNAVTVSCYSLVHLLEVEGKKQFDKNMFVEM